MKKIIKNKEEARQIAIDWQKKQSEKNMSYTELLYWQTYFEIIAKEFDLTEEFRENCII